MENLAVYHFHQKAQRKKSSNTEDEADVHTDPRKEVERYTRIQEHRA